MSSTFFHILTKLKNYAIGISVEGAIGGNPSQPCMPQRGGGADLLRSLEFIELHTLLRMESSSSRMLMSSILTSCQAIEAQLTVDVANYIRNKTRTVYVEDKDSRVQSTIKAPRNRRPRSNLYYYAPWSDFRNHPRRSKRHPRFLLPRHSRTFPKLRDQYVSSLAPGQGGVARNRYPARRSKVDNVVGENWRSMAGNKMIFITYHNHPHFQR